MPIVPVILAVATLTTALVTLIREVKPLIDNFNKEKKPHEELRGDGTSSDLGETSEDSAKQNAE